VVELAVVVVLDDHGAALPRELEQRHAPARAHGHPERELV